MDVRKDSVELVERVVRDHEPTLATFAYRFNFDVGTQSFGKPIFEFADVGILCLAQGPRSEITVYSVIFFRRIV